MQYNGESTESKVSFGAVIGTGKYRIKSACSVLGEMPGKREREGILEKNLHHLKTEHSTLSQSEEVAFNT